MTSLASILLSNLLVACVLALIAMLVGRSGRHATVAHLMWLAVFVKLITPPILLTPVTLPDSWLAHIKATQQLLDVDFNFYFGQVTNVDRQHAATSTELRSSNKLAEAAALKPTSANDRRSGISVGSCLIALWLTGAVALILRGGLRFIRFGNLLRREGMLDPEASEVVQQLLNRDETRFSPPVRRIAARVSPMLFGVGRATSIVCPDSLWKSLSAFERRAFLAHEVAHYQRRDHWVRWLEWLVTAIYWWMPLIYLARLQLERHEEAACDAWALRRLKIAPRSYAETLLSVVDFLSESRTGAPRLASRMQPTASLEERLRLIMQWQQPNERFAKRYVAVGAGCAALLVIHPTPLPSNFQLLGSAHSRFELAPDHREPDPGLFVDRESDLGRRPPLTNLPPTPFGWWNSTPSRTWADRVLGENELHLLARVGIGIGVSHPGKQTYRFDPENVRAMAYVVPSGRLVIGTSSGELHLWDAAAQQSVSLLGKHNAGICSIAFHPSSGLISADQTGTIIAWDIRSGQMLATRSFSGPIGSVRWSSDGGELAVMIGDWMSDQRTHHVHLLDPEQLETKQSVSLPSTIAVVPFHQQLGWLAIDWSGVAWSLTEGQAVDRLEKQLVSGVVMCQDLFPITSVAGSSRGSETEFRQQ